MYRSSSKGKSSRTTTANLSVLSRYVKTSALLAILAAVLSLWLLQTLFAYLNELGSIDESYTITDALRYIFYRSPYFLEQFMPTGALLGAVVGLGLLANKSELIVMRASGISIYRIISWVLQPALIFVLLSLAINQFVLPSTNRMALDVTYKSSDIVSAVRGYWTVQPSFDTEAIGAAQPDGKDVLYIDYADVEGNIGQVKRWHLDEDGRLQTAVVAAGGQYVGRVPVSGSSVEPEYRYEWQLNNMTTLKINQGFDSSQDMAPADILSLPFSPESVYLLTRYAEDLSLTQLYDHRKFMRQQNKRSLEHELAFWQKLLSPLSILSLVIVACSFVFGSLRTHTLGLRIVVALLFGLLFSYVQDLVGFVSLATGFSPLLMVLLPIIGSAALGFYLIKRQM